MNSRRQRASDRERNRRCSRPEVPLAAAGAHQAGGGEHWSGDTSVLRAGDYAAAAGPGTAQLQAVSGQQDSSLAGPEFSGVRQQEISGECRSRMAVFRSSQGDVVSPALRAQK